MPAIPFSEEFFSAIQSKSPLAQFEAISSDLVACYLGEETNARLATTSFQVVVESEKLYPEPSPGWTPQLPLLLVPQTFSSFAVLLWTCSHTSISFLEWGAQNWAQDSMSSQDARDGFSYPNININWWNFQQEFDRSWPPNSPLPLTAQNPISILSFSLRRQSLWQAGAH